MKNFYRFLIVGFVPFFLSCAKSEESAGVPDISLGATISGIISISPELQNQLKPTDTLFIIARKDVGPPMAVKRINAPQFPFAYVLTSNDAMLPGTPFQGEVKIIARVDRDGGAGPAQPGDLEGIAKKNPARVGERDVDVIINKLVN